MKRESTVHKAEKGDTYTCELKLSTEVPFDCVITASYVAGLMDGLPVLPLGTVFEIKVEKVKG